MKQGLSIFFKNLGTKSDRFRAGLKSWLSINCIRYTFSVVHIFFLLLYSPCLIAQVKFYTVVSEDRIETGQAFKVQYIIEGSLAISGLDIPRFDDFEVSEVYDVTNSAAAGSLQHGVKKLYSKVVILSSRNTGKFTIPGATATIGGRTMKSNNVKVVIRKNRRLNASPDPFAGYSRVEDESELQEGETPEGKIRNNFFLKAEVSKSECFVGEPIMATFKAYSRLNANSQVVKRPSLSGFSVMEMVDSYNSQPTIEKFNGKLFYVHLIRKVQLFPLQPGTFELEGAEVESIIHFMRSDNVGSGISGLRDLFRAPRKSGQTRREKVEHHITLQTPPVKIIVNPLPEAAQPIEYSGAVGRFTVSMQINDPEILRSDPVAVTLMVKGTGNFPLITSPVIQWPNRTEISDPLVKEEINKYVFPLSGTKSFEYILHAMDTGSYVLDPVRFSFFDPDTKMYRTVETQPVNYSVLQPEGSGQSITRQKIENPKRESGIPLHFYWFGGVVVIILGWIVYQLFHSGIRKSRVQAPVEKPVDQPAKEYHTKIYLDLARAALEKKDKNLFYNRVQQTIHEAAAEKHNIAPERLTKNSINLLFRQHKLPQSLVDNISDLLNECEWALYTPGYSQENMEEALLKLETLLGSLFAE